MNTFLPYADCIKSAQSLDYRRLGKQRVEAFQLIKIIGIGPRTNGKVTPWYNHPATQMWINHVEALKYYYNCMVEEWIYRGYNNTMKLYPISDFKYPSWFGNDDFHLSHRSNLLRKDRNFYQEKFEYGLVDSLPYIWPKG